MPTSTASGLEKQLALSVFLLATIAACGDDDTGDDDDAGIRCMRDESEDRPTAIPDVLDVPTEGYLCPENDEDWYAVTVPPADSLLHVGLEMLTMRSPVDATYQVRGTSDDQGVIAAPDDGTAGDTVDDYHCVGPGDYFVIVEDSAHDAQDLRSPYELTLGTLPEPDGNEPNAAQEAATTITSGTATTGYIACRADEDWFAIDAADGQVLSLRFESEIVGYDPLIRLFDPEGMIIGTAESTRASVEAPDVMLARVLESGGRYFVAVSDDDGSQSDATVPYQLTVTLNDDADDNEPNDTPAQATPLSTAPVGCGGASFVMSGTIGAAADLDWFSIPVMGCARGVIEAELTVAAPASAAAAWDLQSRVQAALSLVRTHSASPCGEGSDCRALTIPCANDGGGWECSGLGNSCRPDGFCSGESTCNPGGCAAAQVLRNYDALPTPDPIGAPPEPNRAFFSAPVLENATLFLRVSDYQTNGGDPSATYTLNVRLFADPDANERNNLYSPTVPGEYPFEQVAALRGTVPTHNCTAGADCCGSGTWIEGYLSYEADLDFFKLDHPCPGSDCLLNIHTQVAMGDVAPVIQLFHGGREYFGDRMPVNATSVATGVFGRDASTPQCVLGSAGLEGDYTIVVRDDLSDGMNASTTQSYRFCVEKVTNACAAPCMDDMELGCGDS